MMVAPDANGKYATFVEMQFLPSCQFVLQLPMRPLEQSASSRLSLGYFNWVMTQLLYMPCSL